MPAEFKEVLVNLLAAWGAFSLMALLVVVWMYYTYARGKK